LEVIPYQVCFGTGRGVEGGQRQSPHCLWISEDNRTLKIGNWFTRSGSSMSKRKSMSIGPKSSSNAGLDSAKVYRIAATTVARPVGFASLMRFLIIVRILRLYIFTG